jgi:hypothetical protein
MGTATLLIVILVALTALILLAVLGVVSASIRREDCSLKLESRATRAVDKRVRYLTGLRVIGSGSDVSPQSNGVER